MDNAPTGRDTEQPSARRALVSLKCGRSVPILTKSVKLTVAQEVRTYEHRPCAEYPHAGGALMTFAFVVPAALMVTAGYALLHHGSGLLSWRQA